MMPPILLKLPICLWGFYAPKSILRKTPPEKNIYGTELIKFTGIASVPKIGKYKAGKGGTLKEALVKRDRTVFRYRDRLKAFDTAFYRREKLPLKTAVKGPAIILQTDSTTVVPPGCTITADEGGNLILKVGAAR
jgi:N-methylhydantoinase A